jgi:hypothetical protein
VRNRHACTRGVCRSPWCCSTAVGDVGRKPVVIDRSPRAGAVARFHVARTEIKVHGVLSGFECGRVSPHPCQKSVAVVAQSPVLFFVALDPRYDRNGGVGPGNVDGDAGCVVAICTKPLRRSVTSEVERVPVRCQCHAIPCGRAVPCQTMPSKTMPCRTMHASQSVSEPVSCARETRVTQDGAEATNDDVSIAVQQDRLTRCLQLNSSLATSSMSIDKGASASASCIMQQGMCMSAGASTQCSDEPTQARANFAAAQSSTLQAPLHVSQQLNTQSLATMSLREIVTSVNE